MSDVSPSVDHPPAGEQCYDCEMRPATTERDGEGVCAQCAAEWDDPKVSPQVLARFRRAVHEYKIQPAWLDASAVMRAYDNVVADRDRLSAELTEARADAVVARRRREAATARDLARVIGERDEALAEVERLRADLAKRDERNAR